MTGASGPTPALIALGLPVSVYHLVLERLPSLEGGLCDPANPCTIIWVQRFGYLTIPALAATAQALVAALLLLVRSPASPVDPAEPTIPLEVT